MPPKAGKAARRKDPPWTPPMEYDPRGELPDWGFKREVFKATTMGNTAGPILSPVPAGTATYSSGAQLRSMMVAPQGASGGD